ncbi:MAG: CobW family GTP-binding protein [Desulforhopalus sp.]
METVAQCVKTTLICGFLGAGKTTFIRDQLHDNRHRTVVLVNEFGTLAFDGAVMQEIYGLQVVEMTGGCICCSQKLQLAEEITNIVNRFQPQRLFIEPSGVAEASEVIGILTELSKKKLIQFEGVVAIVDAETFIEYSEPDAFGTFFLDQVCNADMILVNKVDLVATEYLQLVIARIHALISTALIVSTSFSRVSTPLPGEREERPLHQHGEQKPAWEYVCLKPSVQFSEQKLHELMALMNQDVFGKILRAKGVLQAEKGKWFHLQLVGNRWTMEKQDALVSPRFTCIGFNLDRNRLEACFAGRDFSTSLPSLMLCEPDEL